ncbi:hypothetical protein ACJJIG_18865 [Microbulbifer sp. SSSA007]|uniref:hypothetical protein n=1 Tax=Microbulbifer sp. SSSA007 TaxID=3243379 RepID=UPI0040395F7A
MSKTVKYLSSKIPQPYILKDTEWWVRTGSKEIGVVKVIEFEGIFCGVIIANSQADEHVHSA